MNEQFDLLELAQARTARDEALDRVTRNAGDDWLTMARRAILALPCGFEGTGEAIRFQCAGTGLPPPHHHNAWGGVMNWAIRSGVLSDTGRIEHMRGSKSHARRSPVWRKAA